MTPIVGAEKVPFTLAQLVVFRMVARTGTFAAAALALSISAPAVSKTMATLEQVQGGSRCPEIAAAICKHRVNSP